MTLAVTTSKKGAANPAPSGPGVLVPTQDLWSGIKQDKQGADMGTHGPSRGFSHSSLQHLDGLWYVSFHFTEHLRAGVQGFSGLIRMHYEVTQLLFNRQVGPHVAKKKKAALPPEGPRKPQGALPSLQ